MPDLTPRRLLRLALLMMLVLLAGCAGRDEPPPEPPSFNTAIEEAVQRMLDDYPDLHRYTPMVAATFVDIDNLKRSSTFGRMGSELFSSELARSGIAVREVKMRNSLYIEESVGELILSREIRKLVAVHDARAILMGTYAVGQREVYVSARIVRASDSLVLGTAHFSLTLDNHLRSMLGTGF